MKNTTKGVKHSNLTKHVSDYFYTEDTKYEKLLVRTIYGHWREYYNTTLNKLPFFNSYYTVYQHIYIINNDNTHTLLWSNGKLVR